MYHRLQTDEKQDIYYRFYSLFIQGTFRSMFPFLFRIGPIFIAEVLLLIIGSAQIFIQQLLPCYGYTFLELSLQLFLIEIIIVLRLIQRNKQLRVAYISKLVFGTKKQYLQKQVWNGICIGAVIVGLLYWMTREGLILTDSGMRDSQKIYTLYPLCFFSDLTNHPESVQQFGVVMNFLYSCNVFLNLLLAALSARSFYLYSEKIRRNRQYFIQNSIQTSESLIDCRLINETITKSLVNHQNLEGKQCGICLSNFCSQKIVRLRCSHHFHQECINLWLQKKDLCPYRCV